MGIIKNSSRLKIIFGQFHVSIKLGIHMIIVLRHQNSSRRSLIYLILSKNWIKHVLK